MADVLLPPWIIPEVESQEWLDEGSSVFQAAFAPGIAQRQSFGGLRLKLSRRHTVRGEEKAQLLSILNSTRGRYNALRTKVHFALRGSGMGGELLPNNTFGSGTTGWTTGGSGLPTLAVTDRIARLTQGAGVSGGSSELRQSSAVTVSQYAAYVARAMIGGGRGGYAGYGLRFGSTAGSNTWGQSLPSTPGFAVVGAASDGTSAFVTPMALTATSANVAGDYVSIPYVSLTRCGLVDNAPNLLLQSNSFGTAPWTLLNATVSASGGTAPDGSTSAMNLREDTASGQHYTAQDVIVSSSAADYALTVHAQSNSRDWLYMRLIESTGSTAAIVFFNTTTGALGTITTGANWSNVRGHIALMGGSYYRCTIVARKTSAGTTLSAYVGAGNADNSLSYAGTGTNTTHLIWEAALAASAFPTRVRTTTAAAAAAAAQSGGALYLKGLPASTSGLLLPGDWFEFGGELKQCAVSLNSDASTMGYLQFEPTLVRAPANNDPVVTTDPMGKFLVSNIKIDNQFGTQARVSYDLEHIYE